MQRFCMLAMALGVCFPAWAQLPSIKLHGIVNAASFASPGLPSGSIARGSIFTIFGGGLGPAKGVQVSAFPIQNTLSGVTITVTQGATVLNALPLYVRQDQINALMPSGAPTGWVSVRVTYNNARSNPSPVYVVNDSVGVFTSTGTGLGPGAMNNFVTQSNQPANSLATSAKPGQVVTMYATGLGPISAPDNLAPPSGSLQTPVELWVGGVQASVSYSGRSPCCSGLDQVTFTVPDNAPQGCWVPVQVRTSHATLSNFVSMGIDPNGAPCSDPSQPLSAGITKAGHLGLLTLARLDIHEDVGVNAPVDITNDVLTFSATNQPGGPFVFQPFVSTPPLGTCTVYPAIGDFFATANVSSVSPPALNGGTQFTLAGPGGQMAATLSGSATALGAYLPLYSFPNQLYLSPGKYTITSKGGADIPGFNASITVPGPLTWTSPPNTVDRSQPLALSWTGAPSGTPIMILGVSSDLPTNSSAMFVCVTSAGANNFTVPAEVLSALPASRANPLSSKAVIYLMSSNPGTFTAGGLNTALTSGSYIAGKTVVFQ